MTRPDPDAAGPLRLLGAAHDGVTLAGYRLAALGVAIITVSYCYEVVARYFFNAPTQWATPLVNYCLLSVIFLSMPELARRNAHIAINLLLERLPPARARVLAFLVRAATVAACFLAAWFSADSAVEQFNQGVWTTPPFAAPKWLVSAVIPYGMLSTGIYFLRQLRTGARVAADQQIAA